MIAGVDISNNQGTFNAAAMKAAGYEFCIHKSSEGVGFKDRFLESRWREMKAANLARGVYHFCRPSQTPAVAEADYFTDIVGPLLEPGDSVYADVEDERFHGNVSPWTLAFCERVEQTVGFRPLVYTYPAYVNERQLTDPALAKYPLWWASYSTTMRPAPKPWKTVAIWQYTSDGQVPGTPGRIDLNHFLGDDIKDFLALGKPGGVPATDDEKMETYYRNNSARLGPKKYAAMLDAHYFQGKILVCTNGIVTPDGEVIAGNVVDDWEGVQGDNLTPL